VRSDPKRASKLAKLVLVMSGAKVRHSTCQQWAKKKREQCNGQPLVRCVSTVATGATTHRQPTVQHAPCYEPEVGVGQEHVVCDREGAGQVGHACEEGEARRKPPNNQPNPTQPNQPVEARKFNGSGDGH
jgi:hypothetical protein